MPLTSVLWLRRDLRRRDHPALLAARDAAQGGDLVVAFVVDPQLWDGGGAARRAWLAATLEATDEAFDGALTLLHGDPRRVVPELAAAGRRHLGARLARDDPGRPPPRRGRGEGRWARTASSGSRPARRMPWGPVCVRQRVGGALQGVHAVLEGLAGARLAGSRARRPRELPLRHARNDADATAAVKAALAAPDLPELPPAGEEAALERWRAFRDGALTAYGDDRNRPDLDGTSRLSPYLKLGVLHPRTLLADLADERGSGAHTYENELAWREFYADVLWHQPRTSWHDLRPEMARMRYDEPAGRHRGVEGRAHRLPDRRRRHAPAARAGLDAQPAADDHGELPHQGPARVVAGRCPALPRPPRRRRHRVEQPRLAVGGRHRHRRLALLPGVQPGHPGHASSTPTAPTCGAGCPSWRTWPGAAAHEPWDAADGYAHGYPQRIVDHAAERVEALSRLEATKRLTVAGA